jgi:uncharacterized repeat protein (TIGR02543 family)
MTMVNISKKILSAILTFAILLTLFPFHATSARAANDSSALTISVDSVNAIPGDTVDVDIRIKNNPGILGMTLYLWYDENVATLTGVEESNTLSGMTFTTPKNLHSGCCLLWDAQDVDLETVQDGIILTLSFAISEEAESGDATDISLTYDNGGIIDGDMNPLEVKTVAGGIQIVHYTPGDLNDDKIINSTDVVLLRRYIAGGYGVSIIEEAGDVNDDGVLNSTDVVLIRRYIAGGYGVELKASQTRCHHTMTPVPYKAATCQETGNVAYWHCSECGKNFLNASGSTEATEDDILLEKTNHTIVTDQAVAATSTSTGLTEGSHCSVCGTVVVAQEEIPMLEVNEYSVTYYVANGDSYLEEQTIENPNPTSVADASVCYLKGLNISGYTFLGWYDGAGDNAEQVKTITNADHDIELYAHWKLNTYKVVFNYDTVLAGVIDTTALANVTYTVNETTSLPILYLPGYTFVGWSDENGNICTQIKPGSTGEKHYYANWISNRNQAWALKNVGDPYVYDDNGVILFCYEIGKMTDVPIDLIEDFGYINSNGVSQTVTKKVSIQTNSEMIKAYSSAIEASTTGNATWTLSNGWTDSVSIGSEYAKEHGMTVSEAETQSKSDTGSWYVNKSAGGSSTSTTIDSTDTYALNTHTTNDKTYGSTDTTTYDNHTNVSGYEINGSLEIGAKETLKTSGILAKVGAKGSVEFTQNLTVGGEYENKTTDKTGTDTVKKTGTDTDDGSSDQTGTVSNHTTNTSNTSTWNNESGYSGSQTNTASKTVAQAISETINEKTSIGQSYINTGSSTNSQGLSSTNANKDEFSSKVTYSEVTYEEMDVSYTTGAAVTGYHRWVMAATAHVYGVVGYDVANNCYFTYTYSVMDDDFHKYEDYSYSTSDYDDNQSGIIDFNVPDDIVDYVESRVFSSDGLEIDLNGTVTAYTGSDSLVVIPDYAVIDNKDGTKQAIKVTGIAEGVFTNNECITGVALSDYITEIPNDEFKGCTSLWDFAATGVTSIGANAFAGCANLQSFTVSSEVIELGETAFASTSYLEVEAANASIVEKAVKSGADEITIDLSKMSDSLDGRTLKVPEGTKAFVLRAFGTSCDNLEIESYADATKLNRMTINSNTSLPLKLYSKEVSLNQVTVNATSAAMALLADNTELSLYGPVSLTSGAYTLFVKNATLSKVDGNLNTRLDVSGSVVTCGVISDPGKYMNISNGEINVVDDDTFNKMLHSYTLYFDANGGSCDTNSIEVPNGMAIGTLPTPTRENYGFAGWYTEADGGTQVTDGTVFSSMDDITIYAHWNANQYTVSWDTGAGYVISVSRVESPNANATIGALNCGDAVYYGDVLSVSYAAATGYNLGSCGSTNITVFGDVTAKEIYASASAIGYTVSWSTGTGYSITVSRTSSPNANAATGSLKSGAAVYYGDVLSVTYTASTGYTLGSSGKTSITVTRNVTASDIYASATANKYTYNIVYKSSNGTSLGTSTATYAYGTTNTVSAPSKSGYTTPSSQSVKWDSTSAKTITFTYSPTSVSSSQSVASGTWWTYNSSPRLTYSVTAEYQNRTSTSVQVRIKWTNTLVANYYYGYAQYFSATIGGVGTGNVTIASASTFSSQSSSARSNTAYSSWITVPVSATQTSVSISGNWWDSNYSGTFSKTISIPTY